MNFAEKMELAAKKSTDRKTEGDLTEERLMATVKRCSQSLPLAAMKSVFMPVIRQEYGQHPQ
ncbi:hypothetical protein HT118_19420 [Escherichia coli]|nr:hypothetical protein [Escherichia coli]